MREFATTETQGNFHLVAIVDELVHLLHLHIIIMIIDVRAHLDLFDVLRFLRFTRGIGLFLGLIFIFADIEEFRDRRIRIRRDFDKIKADICGLFNRFVG